MTLIFMHRTPTREVFADRSKLCGRKEEEMAEKAVSTINTILEISEDGKVWEKLCPIKNYPKLGGAPNQLETTDLEDESQTFINGVQSMDSMEFKANYLLEPFKTVLAKSGIPLHYRLSMGKDGKDGVATWEGEHAVYVNEGEVNGVREMTINVSPSTKISIGDKTA